MVAQLQSAFGNRNVIINPYRYSAGGDSTLLDDLVSWWSLDETSGTRYDSHGSNDLTDINTVGYVAGKQSNAADFVATNNELLKTLSTDMAGGNRDWTIACWVKPDVLKNYNNIVNCGTGVAASGNDYVIQGTSSGTWALSIADDSSYTALISTDTISAGTWGHLVFGYNSSSAKSFIYVNNGTIAESSAFGTAPTEKGQEFKLGEYSTSRFNGSMDEVAFWNRLLTASEITALYNSGAGIAYPS